MAELNKKQNKDGTTSYSVRVYLGRDRKGKAITKSKTLNPPPGMKGKKLEKWLQKEADELEEKMRNGYAAGSDMKLDELIDRWFEDYAAKQLKPKTIYNYQQLRPRISAGLGHLKVCNIKPLHLMEFYKNLQESGIRRDSTYTATAALMKLLPRGKRGAIAKQAGISEETMRLVYKGQGVSRQTAEKVSGTVGLAFSKAFTEHNKAGGKLKGNSVQHYHAMLSSVFKKGVQWGLVEENPCTKAERPKAECPEMNLLSEEDMPKLFDCLENAPAYLSMIVQLALFTGARRGELCGLRWSDIDFEHKTISINRNLIKIPGQGAVFSSPKTKKSQRCFRIGASCVDLLREYKHHQTAERFKVGSQWIREIQIEGGKTVENDLLFTAWNGAPIDPHRITKEFSELLNVNGLPHVTFHSLRHLNATLQIADHVPITTVSGRLGHAQTSTTLNIYASAVQSADAAAADSIENTFNKFREKQHA